MMFTYGRCVKRDNTVKYWINTINAVAGRISHFQQPLVKHIQKTNFCTGAFLCVILTKPFKFEFEFTLKSSLLQLGSYFESVGHRSHE